MNKKDIHLLDDIEKLKEEYKNTFMEPKQSLLDSFKFLGNEDDSLYCNNHKKINKNLRVCFNPDCPFKIFCSRCERKHVTLCSRIKMDVDLNELESMSEDSEEEEVEVDRSPKESDDIIEQFKNNKNKIIKFLDEIEDLLKKKGLINSKKSKMNYLKNKHKTCYEFVKENSKII